MYIACQEHIELAMDHIVDENETFPIMEQCNEPKKCSFCDSDGLYIVKQG